MIRAAALLLAVVMILANLPPEGGSHQTDGSHFRLPASRVALRQTAVAVAKAGRDGDPPREVTREVYLMGTRATLTTRDADRHRALERLEALLHALEDTDAQLSTWRDQSEISRLNASAGSGPVALSPSLCTLFREIDRWSAETGRAFDPAIGALTAAWDVHGPGRFPAGTTLTAAMRHSGWKRTRFDPVGCITTLPAGVAIDVGGFGKGEALDRARATTAERDAPWMIDLGGQVASGGAAPAGSGWPIAIAHPWQRDEPLLTCAVKSGSLSTSGGSERDLQVEGRRVGHILDPRTGQPAPFHGSVSVWHERALVADMLSTALYVMGPEEGIRWSDAHRIAALFLVPAAGGAVNTRSSRSWTDLGVCATTSP